MASSVISSSPPTPPLDTESKKITKKILLFALGIIALIALSVLALEASISDAGLFVTVSTMTCVGTLALVFFIIKN